MAITRTTYKSGKSGYVSVGGTRVDHSSWTFNHDVERIDCGNTGSGGCEEAFDGWEKASGTIEHIWNGNGPFPLFQPGQGGSGEVALKLYIEANGDYHDIPTASITGLVSANEVKTGIKYTVNWESNGVFTPAGGSAADGS